MSETGHVFHTIDPIWNSESQVLILGTMPSPKSREASFYYAHPQNRFWKVMRAIFNVEVQTVPQKIECMHNNKIALWDVIQSCDINRASDSSIKNVVPNDITPLIEQSCIKHIITNGTTAFRLYNKYMKEETGIESICLPSTSPANAKFSIDDLVNEYKIILEYVDI